MTYRVKTDSGNCSRLNEPEICFTNFLARWCSVFAILTNSPAFVALYLLIMEIGHKALTLSHYREENTFGLIHGFCFLATF